MFRVLVAGAAALLIVLPAITAPAPRKEPEKPLPPATPEQRRTTVENLKLFGLAFHNYHDTNGSLPTNIRTRDGKPGLSWRVAILPYMDADNIYMQFKLDEPWDSDHNKKLIEQMPKVYAPVRGRAEAGQTFYQMFSGARTLLATDAKGISLAQIPDGTSLTLMVVEGGKPVIWTKPDDLPFDGKAVPKLGGNFDGEFYGVMGDGAARRFSRTLDPEILRRLIDRADGHSVDINNATTDADKD